MGVKTGKPDQYQERKMIFQILTISMQSSIKKGSEEAPIEGDRITDARPSSNRNGATTGYPENG